MKYLLVLLFTVSAFGQSIQDRVNKFDKPKDYEVRYDKFRKTTEVSAKEQTVKSFRKGSFISNSVMYLSIDLWIDDSGKQDVFLAFRGNSSGVCRPVELRLLLNGETVIILTDDSIDCVAVFSVTAKQLEQIAKAKTIEMQLNSFEGKFEQKTLDVFVDLFSLTKFEPR